MRRGDIASSAALCLALTGGAQAQTIDLPPTGATPPQVIPAASDPGTPAFSAPPGGETYGGGWDSSASVAPPAAWSYGSGGGSLSLADRTDALAALQSQSYGATAIGTAQRLGVNPNGVAAIAHMESGFRNVGTANGSTSATGPWQITSGTWSDTVARYSLPYTAEDRTNPEAQAVVANYIIRQYGGATSQSLGRIATTRETYYSYLYGPESGRRIVLAEASTPLSDIVPAQHLRNNGMSSWTVGNLQAHTSSKLGSAANQPIFAIPGP